MRKCSQSDEYEVVFVKKSLHFTLPSLDNMHERKNPFNKTLKLGTMRPGMVSPRGSPEPPIVHAQTMLSPAKTFSPRVFSSQVPQPISPLTEVSDSIVNTLSSWLSDSESDGESELNFSGEESVSSSKASIAQPHPSPGIYYTVPLSKEVEFNFRQLQHLPSVTPGEILARSLRLPDKCLKDKRSNKTLLLDLDDTLIHTIDPNFNYAAKGVTHTGFRNLLYHDNASGQIYSIKVLVRPYAQQLLKELSSIYEIVVSLPPMLTSLDLHRRPQVLCQCHPCTS